MSIVRLFALGMLLLLPGCSAQWHLNKAIRKNPSLLEKEIVSVVDTVIIPGVSIHDTLVFSKIDTVEIVKDNFHVKLVRVRDSIFIQGGCKTDTLIRTVSIPIEKIIYKEKNNWFDKVKLFCFYVILVIMLAALVQRIIKKNLWW